MGRKTEKSLSEKRSLIMKASVNIIARKGFHGATVEEIGNEAGVASGLVYSYFKNKLDLLLTATLDFWRDINALTRKEIAERNDSAGKLMAIITHVKNLLLRDHYALLLGKVLLETLPDVSQIADEGLRKKRKDIAKEHKWFLVEIDNVIRSGQLSGMIDDSVSSAILRTTLYAIIERVIFGLFLKENKGIDVGYNRENAERALDTIMWKLIKKGR